MTVTKSSAAISEGNPVIGRNTGLRAPRRRGRGAKGFPRKEDGRGKGMGGRGAGGGW